MKVNPYLIFDGQCAEAFRFYAQTLNGRIGISMTHAESPVPTPMPPEARDRIMHVSLIAGDAVLMGGDSAPGHATGIRDSYVSLALDTADEAERIYAALAEGGSVIMPLQETFWAVRFGMLVDRFGTPWMVNVEKPPP